MNTLQNPSLTPNAQKLRREMTKEERHLWYDFLKKAPFEVKRQKPIGHYIADFYIPCARLVVELDGNQHGDDEDQVEKDARRDQFMTENGLRVLRFPNREIWKNFEGVCSDILAYLPEEIYDEVFAEPEVTPSSQEEGK